MADLTDGSLQQAPDDLVFVKEAARDTGIPFSQLYRRIKHGELAAQKTPRGLVVSLSAVRRLVAADTSTAPLPALSGADATDWMPVLQAAMVAGVSRATLHWWVRKGLIPTQQGRYGTLVRPGDVRALATRHSRTRGRDETQE